MKILYFDTETTGTDPRVHEITQFAAIVEIDGVVKSEVNFFSQPTDWEAVDPQALAVTGKTLNDLQLYPTPQEMMIQLKELFDQHINKYDPFDKFYPAGHNVPFDLEFLQAFWKKHGDKYGIGSYCNWRALDTRVIGNFLSYAGKIKCEDMKLSTLCNEFGISLDAHDALNDIRACRTLLQKFKELLAKEYKESSFEPIQGELLPF